MAVAAVGAVLAAEAGLAAARSAFDSIAAEPHRAAAVVERGTVARAAAFDPAVAGSDLIPARSATGLAVVVCEARSFAGAGETDLAQTAELLRINLRPGERGTIG